MAAAENYSDCLDIAVARSVGASSEEGGLEVDKAWED
jgi:hypothetical protein